MHRHQGGTHRMASMPALENKHTPLFLALLTQCPSPHWHTCGHPLSSPLSPPSLSLPRRPLTLSTGHDSLFSAITEGRDGRSTRPAGIAFLSRRMRRVAKLSARRREPCVCVCVFECECVERSRYRWGDEGCEDPSHGQPSPSHAALSRPTPKPTHRSLSPGASAPCSRV